MSKLNFENVEWPEVSCQKQRLDLPPVQWKKIVERFLHQGEEYEIRPIDESDIPKVAGLYKAYYPHLYRSARHFFLEENFYHSEVALLSNWEKDSLSKLYFMGLIEKVKDKEAIFAFGCGRDPHDRAAQLFAVILKPEYRQTHLTEFVVRYIDDLLEKSGFDYAFGTASARHVLAQKAALKVGYKIGGIMPGSYRYSYDGKEYCRDMTLYMYKFYNGSERYSTSPKDWALSTEIAEKFVNVLLESDSSLKKNPEAIETNPKAEIKK